jgi:hypothetical protein
VKLITLLLAFLLGVTVAFAQVKSSPSGPVPGDKFAGTYEGTVKGQRIVLDLKTAGGNFEGSLMQGEKTYKLEEGSFTGEGVLSLGFDKDAKLVGKLQGDKIVGDLTVATEKSPIELKRAVAATTPATAAAPATTAAPINLSGDWEAVADANGEKTVNWSVE